LQTIPLPRIFRRDVVAGLTLLTCLILWKSPTYRYATYLQLLPDRVIILATLTLGAVSPDTLESEFMSRISDPALSAANASNAIPALIERLRADERAWNGWAAADALGRLLVSADVAIATATDAALEAALRDSDRQTRQLAAGVLRRHIESVPNSAPSPQLLAVTVEGLDSDDLDNRSGWLANAREGVTFLHTHAPASAGFLRHKLSDSNPQGRWLAAVIIARSQLTDLMPDAAPILIEQLRDNDTLGDERIAADALRHFGPEVIPLLTPHFESDDAQLRTWCGRLVREVREAESGLTPAPILPSRHMLVYQPGSNNTPATLPADP
jgi:HEAT repeat protein